jgi:hypothetical protein
LLESLGGTTPVTGGGAGNAITMVSQVQGAPVAPTLAPDITGLGVAYAASNNQTIATGVIAPYSITQTFAITLNAGANLSVTGRTDLVAQAVPEPATAALALSGLPLVGLLFARRLRRR